MATLLAAVAVALVARLEQAPSDNTQVRPTAPPLSATVTTTPNGSAAAPPAPPSLAAVTAPASTGSTPRPGATTAAAPAPAGTKAGGVSPAAPIRTVAPVTTAAPIATVTPRPGRPNTAGTDLALRKPVSASSTEGQTWRAELAVDGDPESRWGSSFADDQWIAVDLGELWSVSRVELDWESAHGTEYRIELSADGSTWRTAYLTSAGQGGNEKVSFTPAAARWVRMYGVRHSNEFGFSLYRFAVR